MSYIQFTPAVAAVPAGSALADEWYVFWGLAKRLGLSLKFGSQTLANDRAPTENELLTALLARAQLPLEDILAAEGGRVFESAQTVLPGSDSPLSRFDLAPDNVPEEIRSVLAERYDPNGGGIEAGGIEAGSQFTHRLSVRRMRGVVNTSYHYLPKNEKGRSYNAAFLNPLGILELGLQEGAEIAIVSKHGRIPAIVEADASVHRKVVSMTHGWGTLPGKTADFRKVGSSTSLLVDSRSNLETINGMARLSAILFNIVPLAAHVMDMRK